MKSNNLFRMFMGLDILSKFECYRWYADQSKKMHDNSIVSKNSKMNTRVEWNVCRMKEHQLFRFPMIPLIFHKKRRIDLLISELIFAIEIKLVKLNAKCSKFIMSLKADFHSGQNVVRSTFCDRILLKCVQSRKRLQKEDLASFSLNGNLP